MSTSYRTPFVGIGTGRCGTTSLAYILNACHRTKVTHEDYSLLWYGVDDRTGDMIREFRECANNGILRGDIGQCLGANIDHLRASFHDLKVICLHRPKEEVVASFHRYGWQKLRPDDKRAWLDKCYDAKDKFVARSIKAFPVIDGHTVDQACGFYWEMYESIMSAVRQPVIHIEMRQLNEDSQLVRIFDFLEIPEEDRVFSKKRKWWAQEDVDKFKKEVRRVTTS